MGIGYRGAFVIVVVAAAPACGGSARNLCNTDADCVSAQQCLDGGCVLVLDADNRATAVGEGEGEGEGEEGEGEGEGEEGEGEGEGGEGEGEGEGEEGEIVIPPAFERWASGEPNDTGGEDCLALALPAAPVLPGRWLDRGCGELFKFICDLGDVIVDESSLCRQPIVLGKRYTVCEEHVSWAAASAFCDSRGGSLARVDSAALSDNLAIAAGGVSANSHRMWIGGSDSAAEGDWRWPDGTGIPTP